MSAATVRLPRRDEPEPGLPDLRSYSISRAITAAAEGRQLDGLEGEVHQELARRAGRIAGERLPTRSQFGGTFFLPLGAPIAGTERRDLTVSTGAGAVASPTDIRPARLIDVLRAKSLVATFGAQVFEDMSGATFWLPRKTASAAVTWIGEGSSPSEGSITIDRVGFAPHTESTFVDISRTLLKSSFGTDRLVIGDVTAALATELDRASLAGTGASNQPLGLANDPDIPVAALGTNGAALTFANLATIEETLANANADAATGKLGWITTPAARRKLRLTEKIATSGNLIWGDDNRLLGKPADATSHLPSDGTKGSGTALSAMVFGAWDSLVLGTWGGIDILVDPVTFGTSGGLRIVASLDCDVRPRHNESFIKVVDIITV